MPKQQLLAALTEALKADTSAAAHGVRTVVVLGVGSELRSDDAAGLHVAAALKAAQVTGVHVLDAGPAPENCIGEIRRLHPSHLIMVDCALMGELPGTLKVFKTSEIAGVSFGTHGLPLNVLADYLQAETGCTAAVLGIEPSSLEFGEVLSPGVQTAVEEAVRLLREFLSA
jgi:hydrogenase maturation protease HycI